MYSPLHIQMMQLQQEEIAARTGHRRQLREVRAVDPRGRRPRRRLGKASYTAAAV